MSITPRYDEEYPFLYECGKPHCFYRVVTRTYEEAKEQNKHKCPAGAETNIGASLTQSILEKAWQLLDEAMLDIKSGRDDLDRENVRGRARGIAEVLALFMPPHFRTPDEIAREALKRYQAATADPPQEHETPGLGALRYVFPNDTKYKTALAQAAETKRRVEKGTEVLDDQKRSDIIRLHGMFDAGQVAKMYDVGEKTVLNLWKDL